MALISDNRRLFEKPKTGIFLGTIIDIVYLGAGGKFNKERLRIVWVLNASDSEGQPYRVMRQCNMSINEKSDFYGIVKNILGVAPPVPFESEGLLGRSNRLYVERKEEKGEVYANVIGITPLEANEVGPPVPAGFVRAKDRVANDPNKFAQSSAPQVATQASTAAVGQAAPAATPFPPATAQTSPQAVVGAPVQTVQF